MLNLSNFLAFSVIFTSLNLPFISIHPSPLGSAVDTLLEENVFILDHHVFAPAFVEVGYSFFTEHMYIGIFQIHISLKLKLAVLSKTIMSTE